MAGLAEPEAAISRGLLWAEFVALYIGAPLVIALFMPGRLLFEALALFSLVGLGLLWRTGGFHWQSLVRGWTRLPWREIAGMAVITLILGSAILWWYRPGALFNMLRNRPEFLPV